MKVSFGLKQHVMYPLTGPVITDECANLIHRSFELSLWRSKIGYGNLPYF